jgi:hypothetical protein
MHLENDLKLKILNQAIKMIIFKSFNRAINLYIYKPKRSEQYNYLRKFLTINLISEEKTLLLSKQSKKNAFCFSLQIDFLLKY